MAKAKKAATKKAAPKKAPKKAAAKKATPKKAASKKSGAPKSSNDNDPCWDGYTQLGMKEKKGKEVPNCVPEKK